MNKKQKVLFVLGLFLMLVFAGCNHDSKKEETIHPTGYPTGEVQMKMVFYNGTLYQCADEGFWDAPEKGFEKVGVIEKIDNKNLPAEEFCGSRMDWGQEIYALSRDPDRIFVKFDDGYALFRKSYLNQGN